jgi:hypothetical protein
LKRLSRNFLTLIIGAGALVFFVGSGAASAQPRAAVSPALSPAISWTPQQEITGSGTSAGPALTVFNGQLYALWKGSGSDSGVYWSSTSGS